MFLWFLCISLPPSFTIPLSQTVYLSLFFFFQRVQRQFLLQFSFSRIFSIKILCCKFWQFIIYFWVSINRPTTQITLYRIFSFYYLYRNYCLFFGLLFLFSIISINMVMSLSSVCKVIVWSFLYFVFLQYTLVQRLHSLELNENCLSSENMDDILCPPTQVQQYFISVGLNRVTRTWPQTFFFL